MLSDVMHMYMYTHMEPHTCGDTHRHVHGHQGNERMIIHKLINSTAQGSL